MPLFDPRQNLNQRHQRQNFMDPRYTRHPRQNFMDPRHPRFLGDS